MSLSNGDFHDKSNNTPKALRNRNRDADKENTQLEAAFRGFEKIPFVQLPRLDLKPYMTNKSELNRGSPNNSIERHSKKLLALCSVKLCKTDLLKLKEAIVNKSYSPSSDDDGMANLKCKICEKGYSSEKKLQNHQENKHMIIYKPEIQKPQKRVSFSDHVIIHEVKEYHKCRKCTKIFEDYKYLKVHMKEKHKKRKCYICNYCLKKFVDRVFFKVHIKLHCDVCGKLFPNKTTYLQHRRDSCRVFKLYKCKTCNESYFKFMDLKDHSYEHLGTFFICDICKDQFQTKCAVAHHIGFLHSDRRPTSLYDMRNLGNERLYLCNFCDETAVEREQVELHVLGLPDLSNRAMTGYKDFYFCDQCLKKFATETDMLQHKWTHFLKTSDNSQVRKKSILSKKKHIKTIYNINEKLPEGMQPKVVLERIKVGGKILTDKIDYVDVKTFDVNNSDIQKPVVDPKSKKTIISKYQCQNCGKYYSSRYCLNRHIQTLHCDFENLQCKVCEEIFVWPSLLESHKCIRLNLPEMPFDDARPEIHFDNLHELTQNGFDDLNIAESDSYSVDFEIPAPIVQLTECEGILVDVNNSMQTNVNNYKVVMQEVPIEF